MHSAAIQVCPLLDEATVSGLIGFPVTYFGPTDPVARVPVPERSFVNTKGAALRIAGCGYWETGVAAELSRDVTIQIIQGDPAKSGLWSADAAHGQFGILEAAASAQDPQPVSGVGDEAYVATKTAERVVTSRSGDVVVQVSGDWPPGAPEIATETLTAIAQATLGKL